jgi:mRNA-degrading endonuclease RelE of RelBE toxin-antitoxin system
LYRVILLPRAVAGLERIADSRERESVKAAIGTLIDDPLPPGNPHKLVKRDDAWELRVGRQKVTYEVRRIELVVYVHNVKEAPSLDFDYR